jgi:D-alanyl-D-alanine carboxypeptidase (penicillin-binding protein 5/6)
VIRAARATFLALLLSAVLPGFAAAAKEPAVSAPSAILVDAVTGEVLYEKDPDQRRAIASTTKLMTALLTLENADMDDVFSAASYDPIPAESVIHLRPGERMAVRDLLEALLLESANDAAETLAEGVGGSERDFVAMMNERARELGLHGTHYANPIGLDDPDNYSTARDLTTLATRLMRDPRFAGIVGRTSATLETGDSRRTVDNRNELVSTKLVDGVKTGYTIDAGNVLVGSGRAHGAHVISAVLGEPTESERDDDTLALLDYGTSAFTRHRAVDAGEELARSAVRLGEGQVPLVASKPMTLSIRKGDESAVDVRVSAPPVLEGPLDAGTRVGSAKVLYHGRQAGKVDLQTGEPVPAPALASRARLAVERNLLWLLLLVPVIVIIAVLIRSRRRRSAADRPTR